MLSTHPWCRRAPSSPSRRRASCRARAISRGAWSCSTWRSRPRQPSGGFEKITLPFIDQLGPRLAGWVDHHDHVMHERYRDDPRFVLATKAEHGACPEMVTPEVVARIGPVDTIVCHTDFDGLCSAAKWLRGGTEPYPGADDDARAIDTRIGAAGPHRPALRPRAARAPARHGALRAHRAAPGRRPARRVAVGGHRPRGRRARGPSRRSTRTIAAGYARRSTPQPDGRARDVRSIAFVDATAHHGKYDKTQLLLLGQERASIAIVVDMDTVTLAAPLRQRRQLPRAARAVGWNADARLHPEEAPDRGLEKLGVGGR